MSQHTHVSSTGGIRRGPRLADNFTVLSNAVLNDDRLSFRARGVLMWLLSKPLDWSIRSEAIAQQSPCEGRTAVRTAMRELAEHGYLVREKVQNELGQWATIQTVYEEPVTVDTTPPEPKTRKSTSGQPRDGQTGAFTKDGSPRTETNNNPARVETEPPADNVETKSSSWMDELEEKTRAHIEESKRKLADLEAATLAAGLPASYAKIKPQQKGQLDALITLHGIDALVAAAKRVHRDENPTMHVHGWIRLWLAMPVPRTSPTSGPSLIDDCDLCDEYAWVLGPDRKPVEPAQWCTHGRQAAA